MVYTLYFGVCHKIEFSLRTIVALIFHLWFELLSALCNHTNQGNTVVIVLTGIKLIYLVLHILNLIMIKQWFLKDSFSPIAGLPLEQMQWVQLHLSIWSINYNSYSYVL